MARVTSATWAAERCGGSARKSDGNYMIETPKTVLELFENHPERLVKDPRNSTETAEGISLWDDDSPSVARWCLMTAIRFVYGEDMDGFYYQRFCDSLGEEARLDGCTGFLIRHQDSETREYNFPAIIAKLREVGI